MLTGYAELHNRKRVLCVLRELQKPQTFLLLTLPTIKCDVYDPFIKVSDIKMFQLFLQ